MLMSIASAKPRTHLSNVCLMVPRTKAIVGGNQRIGFWESAAAQSQSRRRYSRPAFTIARWRSWQTLGANLRMKLSVATAFAK
ncbi:hypothetical protein VTL71DRAFT_3429, partial [Oculimacula yallundae]